jgi:hypothetical protein
LNGYEWQNTETQKPRNTETPKHRNTETPKQKSRLARSVLAVKWDLSFTLGTVVHDSAIAGDLRFSLRSSPSLDRLKSNIFV